MQSKEQCIESCFEFEVGDHVNIRLSSENLSATITGNQTVEARGECTDHEESPEEGSSGKKVRVVAKFELKNKFGQTYTIEDFIQVEQDKEENIIEIEITSPDNLGKIDYDIQVQTPPDCNVTGETENAQIRVIGIEGEIELTSENGRLSARKCKGDFRLENENGSIVVEDSEGSFAIETENGSGSLERCTGTLEARTDNGSFKVLGATFTNASIEGENGGIYYEFKPVDKGEFDFRNENGRIHLVIPEGIDYDFTARNENGSFQIGLSGEYEITREDEAKSLRMVKGDGKVRISAENENGSIVVVRDMAENIGRTIHHAHRLGEHGARVARKCMEQVGQLLNDQDVKTLLRDKEDLLREKEDLIREKVDLLREKANEAKEKLISMKVKYEDAEGNEKEGSLLAEIEEIGMEMGREFEEIGASIAVTFEKEFADLKDLAKEGSKKFRGFFGMNGNNQGTPTPPPPPPPPPPPAPEKDDNQGRMKILQMLEEGKITVDQAEKLLKALG